MAEVLLCWVNNVRKKTSCCLTWVSN